MRIWVDADACPNVIKEILFKAGHKRNIYTIFVANQFIRTPPSPYLSSVQVGSGFDVADNHIVQALDAGDLVITADIPLAAEVVEKDAWALNPRGEFYTPENIKQRLTMRNFMEEMRNTGQASGGPPPLNQRDRQVFANELDRFLAKHQ
jgi:uncharacterized protein YaiI (UPF0178 family)